MAPTPQSGQRIGPYEILSPLGAGGMGEVWKARDTRLDRTVAIKFSKQEFGERFEREARSIAALNHPHICTLHDVGPNYLVMEFIDGSPVQGPLPPDLVVLYGGQICEALDAAHRKAITHRDLKPGNVLLTKQQGIKLLDFGLAKTAAPGNTSAAADTEISDATIPAALTGRGVILGTPQYMSPEQIEGKPADPRSDIFALGCLLYEMVTGRRAFDGKTMSSVVGAILAKEPEPLRTLQPGTPAALERIILACLEKDPEKRFQNARDVKLALDWQSELASGTPPEAPTVPRTSRLWLALAVVFGLVAAGLGLREATRSEPEPRPIHFRIPTQNRIPAAIPSPDGSMLLSRRIVEGSQRELFIHSLETGTDRLLEGTEGVGVGTWSPDGKQIAFFAQIAGLKLRTIDLASATVRTLASVPQSSTLGEWDRTGRIWLGSFAGIGMVPASGGEWKQVTKADPQREMAHSGARLLPNDRILFSAFMRAGGAPITFETAVADLTGKELVRLPVSSVPVFYDPRGYLLYGMGTNVRARPFDVTSLQFTGEGQVIGGPVGTSLRLPAHQFAFSEAGVLTWQEANLPVTEMVLFDRKGTRLGVIGTTGDYTGPAISPDGKKVAVALRDPESGERDIWVLPLGRAGAQVLRLTEHPRDDFNPVWSPDGRQILFTSTRSGVRSLYVTSAQSGAEAKLLYANGKPLSAEGWLPDGSAVVFTQVEEAPGSWSVHQVGVEEKTKQAQRVIQAPSSREGHISGDATWIAWHGWDESNNMRFLQLDSYPSTKQSPLRIGEPGDEDPQWASSTGELFYRSMKTNRLMMVRLSATGVPDRPEPLFDLPPMDRALRNNFSVSPDGQQFVFVVKQPAPADRPTHVLLNWHQRLQRPK